VMASRMVGHRSLHGQLEPEPALPRGLVIRLGQLDPVSAEQQRRCALVVAGRARDADDARLLLDVLGLKEA
jgi:hypothetical protein